MNKTLLDKCLDISFKYSSPVTPVILRVWNYQDQYQLDEDTAVEYTQNLYSLDRD